MRIQTVLSVLKEIKYLKSVIKNYGDSLKCGKYYLFEGFRAMSLDNKTSREKAFSYFNKPVNDRVKKKLSHILNKTLYFTNKNFRKLFQNNKESIYRRKKTE